MPWPASAGQADDLVPRLEEFGNEDGTGVPGRAGNKDTHRSMISHRLGSRPVMATGRRLHAIALTPLTPDVKDR